MRTLRKLVWLCLVLPLAAILIAFAVANRHVVRLVLDPMAPTDPALALEAPLFLFLFAALAAGVVAGGIAAWIGQGKWRKSARRRGQEADFWHREAERLNAQIEAGARPRLSSAAGE